MSGEFAALAYDNRVSDSGAWPAGLAAPPLIGTSAFHNVSLRVGRLAAQQAVARGRFQLTAYIY